MLHLSSTLQLESLVFSQVTYFCFYLHATYFNATGSQQNE